MNIVLLFLVAGIIVIYLITKYEKQNVKKIEEDIHRANKNIPPLFMLRSAEQKVNAIKSALKNADISDICDDEVIEAGLELNKLINSYKNRDIALAEYYTKLGALLIKVGELKNAPAGVIS
jgi:Na+-transporting methylmalonyl-CoA/oxaloacetate decarboxylase gamma subunit